MKALISMALTGALLVSGCAVSNPPTSGTTESSMTQAERQAAFESQARGIRTKIIQLKQQVVVQEVMLVNVERRAAMSRFSLSNLPNTEVLSEPSPAVAVTRPETDRLSVAVRPAPMAAAVTQPPVKNKKKPVKKVNRSAPSIR